MCTSSSCPGPGCRCPAGGEFVVVVIVVVVVVLGLLVIGIGAVGRLFSPGRRAVVGSGLALERARESHVGRGGGCLAGGGNPVAIRQCGQGNVE